MDDGPSTPFTDDTPTASPFGYDAPPRCHDSRARPLPLSLTGIVTRHVVPGLLGRVADARSPARQHEDRGMVAAFADLLDREADKAYETFALDLLAACEDPQRVARNLLEPAARLIGAGWCADTRDFARVTFAISRLQRLFWAMVSDCPPTRRSDPNKLALLSPAPGEQHTFGLSIVEDQLRRAGWEVDCCRTGEEAEMYRLVGTNRYAFVGLSLSGNALLPAFSSAIGKIKARSKNRSITVVAGGSLVAGNPQAALAAGADLVVENSRATVVRMAEQVFFGKLPDRRES